MKVKTMIINKVTEIIVEDWEHGARSATVEGKLYYVQYNTGDQVWFDTKSAELKVVAGITRDGIGWGNIPMNLIYR